MFVLKALGLWALWAMSVSAQSGSGDESGMPTENTPNPTQAQNHDLVRPLPEALADNNVQWKYAPSLIVRSGCQVYPAVDESGNWSGGLAPRGKTADGCEDSSRYQVISRVLELRNVNKIGIMYAWFFPKTESLKPYEQGRHRYNWLYAVVWVNGRFAPDSEQTQLEGRSSLYGLWTMADGFSKAGTFAETDGHPRLAKDYVNHYEATIKNAGPGNWHPNPTWITDWENLPSEAHDTLERTDIWEGHYIPMLDSTFLQKMHAAMPHQW